MKKLSFIGALLFISFSGLAQAINTGNLPFTNFDTNGAAVSHFNQGTTNATTLTAFTATFAKPFADTNYTAVAVGNGFALASSYVSAKTTTSCVFNMTVATGNIDWVAIHP